MSLSWVKKKLDNDRWRGALSLLLSINATFKTGKRAKIYFDGDWVHESVDGVIVNPSPLTRRTMAQYLAQAKDFYSFEYEPVEGDVVIDIGAGIGTDTIYYSRCVGATGRVLAIEAQPRTYDCLAKLCKYNKLENVTPINCAAADEAGELRIESDDHHISNSLVEEGGDLITADTLDSICAKHNVETIDFLKMNIEGAERLALRGMNDVFRKVRHLCIACHDFKADRTGNEFFRTKDHVISVLKDKGFRIVNREDERPWVRDHVHAVNIEAT